jgi:hypothetical protein
MFSPGPEAEEPAEAPARLTDAEQRELAGKCRALVLREAAEFGTLGEEGAARARADVFATKPEGMSEADFARCKVLMKRAKPR